MQQYFAYYDDPHISGFPPSQDLDINFDVSSTFTIQFWMKLDIGGDQVVRGQLGTTYIFGIFCYDRNSPYASSAHASFLGSGGTHHILGTPNSTVPYLTWTLLTLIYSENSSKYELYIDGTPAVLTSSRGGNERPLKSSHV
jgi:Concanavalin A-like lectin/glucanases superfamily